MSSKGTGHILKWLKRMVEIVVISMLFWCISTALNYMYVARDSDWARVLWHNFYEDGEKIDNLYLGSSHVYSSINTVLLNDLNGEYNFNLSTARQRPISSYYLLKEADRNCSLSHVYLELFYWCSTMDDFERNTFYSDNWKNTDNMKLSLNKFEYMLQVFEPDKYIDMLLPFSRYRTYLDDWDYIKQTMESKRKDDYLGYYGFGNRQGFLCETGEFLDEARIVEQYKVMEEKPIGKTSEKYIRKIIKYCQSHNIPITLFISPMDELKLVCTGNYDNYINQVKEIAEEYNIEFYDFNLAKEEYLPIHRGEYFQNADHLNGKGADVFTSFFNDFLSRDRNQNEKMYFGSYSEKLQKSIPYVYGIYWCNKKDVDEKIYFVASNREKGMEYKIVLESEGKKLIVQEFSENKRFVIPAEEHGACTIIARMEEKKDKVQSLKINY